LGDDDEGILVLLPIFGDFLTVFTVDELALASEIQLLSQTDKRQQPFSQPQDRRSIQPLDRMFALAATGANKLDNTDLRYGETLGRAFDDEGGHDGQRQRDLD